MYHDKDGVPKMARLDEATFTEEAEQRVTELEQSRGSLLANASHTLHRSLDDAFSECQGPDRVKAFADWRARCLLRLDDRFMLTPRAAPARYYAYATTYELMRVAATAAAAAVPSEVPPREAASKAVATAVLEKYSAIVLRPAQTEPTLQRVFSRAADAARSDVALTLGRINARSIRLLEQHSRHLDGSEGGARLEVDWRSARGTGIGIDHAHSRPSGVPSVALLGGGALVGKAAASAAGKAVATSVSKAMAGKLAAPFVAKIGAAIAPAAASVGGAAGGPVGVVLGGAVGLAVDYALAKGIELAGRAELEKDVAFALRTAQGEWRYAMETELRRAVGTLVDDAVQLTAEAHRAQEVHQGGGEVIVATSSSGAVA